MTAGQKTYIGIISNPARISKAIPKSIKLLPNIIFFILITLSKIKIPIASKTMPAIIPVIARVPPIFPATNIEVRPSAQPMTDTDFVTDF